MLRMITVVFTLVFAAIFYSCSDEPEGKPTDRYVYYADATALHRYGIGSAADEIVAQGNIVYITQVAENGIVLYESEAGGVRHLWGRCEDGGIIPVPMPVAASADEEYLLSATPPSLSWKGHHAAYIAYRRPVFSADTSEWSATLCLFDCAKWEMKLGDISAFLQSRFSALDFSLLLVRIHSVHVTDYGDAVAVSAHVCARHADGRQINTGVLLAFDAAGFRLLNPISVTDGSMLNHIRFDPGSSVLYVFSAFQSAFAVDLRTGDARDLVIPAIPYDPWTPVACLTSEFVESCCPDFVLRRIDTGERTTVLTNVGVVLAAHTDLLSGAGHAPALSPDGSSAAMLWSTSDAAEVLFLIERDGAIQRIAKGRFKAPVVVSAIVPK